jgi:hypothetical protein
MRLSSSATLITILSVALCATVLVENERIDKVKARSADLALGRDSAIATSDTNRSVAAENATIALALGDSLEMTQRRIVQVRQRGDSIDRALGLERIGKYDLTARLDSLQRVVASRSAVTEDSVSRVRRAVFDVRQAPYTARAAVELPAPPDTGRLDLRVALDAIPLVARLSCAPPNADGIRSASIETTSPAWASVRFSDVQQSPDLCRSPALESKTGYRIRPAVVVGFGLIAPSQRELQLGAFAGVALAFSR